MRPLFLAAIVAASISVTPVFAEDAKPACPAEPVLSADYAGWANPVGVSAAASGAKAPALTLNTAVMANLHPFDHLSFTAAPEKAPRPETYGGLLRFEVKTAGTYAVAASHGVWLDVVKDGKIIASTKHGHGPECSGIRKIVSFDLTPGTYVLQISNSRENSVRIMVK